MLTVASEKLAGAAAEGRASFNTARIDELPFEDGRFDGAMINQVLHHLPHKAAEGFPEHRRVFRELARVLKPGDALVVNTCSQEQLAQGCVAGAEGVGGVPQRRAPSPVHASAPP